ASGPRWPAHGAPPPARESDRRHRSLPERHPPRPGDGGSGRRGHRRCAAAHRGRTVLPGVMRTGAPAARLDWEAIGRELDERGHAITPRLLAPAECLAVARMWGDADRFRSHIDMARHRFGLGEYRYFAQPRPAVVARIRSWATPR